MVEILRFQDAEADSMLQRCAAALAAGKLLVLPTDTVYGLAARADIPGAVEALFAAKAREAEKSIVVMVSSVEEAAGLATQEQRETLYRLGSLWPGPLTLVVKTRDIPWKENVAPASDTIGIRIPDNPFLLRLLAVSGTLAVTSANLAGRQAPDSFEDIDAVLLSSAELAVDGGKCGSGKSSTVAEIRGGGIKILRQGETSDEELRRALVKEGEREPQPRIASRPKGRD
jgi:L-threonylcarbamoyladenylate synthase